MSALAVVRSCGRGFVLCVAGGLLLGVGCSGQPSGRTCYPVHGTVQAHGKPAVGALVVFYPAEKADPPAPTSAGTTDAEGRFSLSTYTRDDGAPAGDYKVHVTLQKTGFTRRKPMEKGPRRKGPPGRSNQPRPAVFQAHVSEGPNELTPFDIK